MALPVTTSSRSGTGRGPTRQPPPPGCSPPRRKAGCPFSSCTMTTDQRPGDIKDYASVRDTPLVLAAVLTVLAAGTLAHVLLTGVRRRRRDLALLKTLGLTRSQVQRVVAWEATTFAAVALLVGAARWRRSPAARPGPCSRTQLVSPRGPRPRSSSSCSPSRSPCCSRTSSRPGPAGRPPASARPSPSAPSKERAIIQNGFAFHLPGATSRGRGGPVTAASHYHALVDLLVIGGSGFLGRRVTRQAQLAGHRVTATFHANAPKTADVDWRRLDIRRRDDVMALARAPARRGHQCRLPAVRLGNHR